MTIKKHDCCTKCIYFDRGLNICDECISGEHFDDGEGFEDDDLEEFEDDDLGLDLELDRCLEAA